MARPFDLAPALGALILGALIAGAPDGLRAQDQPLSEQQLIERLRQIQGEVGPGATEQELLERVRRVEEEISGAAPPVEARLSADQVRQRIAEELGVEVLSVERAAAGERPTYALRVMNPPGNYNAAFRVVTLLVDGDSGAVLGELRTTPNAEDPDAFPALRDPGESSGLELRRRTWR